MADARFALGGGHGLTTLGKEMPEGVASKAYKEWELNNRIVEYAIAELENYEGWTHIRLDDPSGKRDVPLSERTRKANDFNADILISIHHNAGAKKTSSGGLTVYAYDGSLFQRTLDLQKSLYKHLIANGGIKGNRVTPLPRANFHMLRESKMSALLPEIGFMDSTTDAPIIIKDSFAKQQGKGIAMFLVDNFNLEKKIDQIQGEDVWLGEVIVDELTVREEPTTNSVEIRTLKKGDVVSVYGRTGSDRYPWLYLGAGYVSNAGGKYVKGYTPRETVRNMVDSGILVHSMDDVPIAERLARVTDSPIYFRGMKIRAKHLFVVGGKAPEGFDGKVTMLSGSDLFETTAEVGKYIKK